MVRQNAFSLVRFSSFKLIIHWFAIIFHLSLAIGSSVVLVSTRTESFKVSQMMRVFISLMIAVSFARIFRLVYEHRWPIVTITEWGTEIYRPINTAAGNLTMFLHKHLDGVSFVFTIIFVLALDKQSAEDAAKASPLLYYTTMMWVGLYFLYFVAPVFLILGLIACLPCLIVIMQRFFNYSFVNPNENQRAAPATQEILENVWKVTYTNDESFKYVNPDDPNQTAIIQKEDTKCSICLGWYEQSDELRILPCTHHFHLGCADEWFKITATCPLCVRPIRPISSPGVTISSPSDDPNLNSNSTPFLAEQNRHVDSNV